MEECNTTYIISYQEVAYKTNTLADLLIAARASFEILIPSGSLKMNMILVKASTIANQINRITSQDN